MTRKTRKPPAPKRGSPEDPIWQDVAIKSAFDRKGDERQSAAALPQDTYELDAWRQSMHAPGIPQSLEDIRRSTYPDLQRRGVDVDALDKALLSLCTYPLTSAETRRQVQRVVNRLDTALDEIYALAKDGLLPGKLAEHTLRAGYELIWEVGLCPAKKRWKQRGAPRKAFLAYHACEIVKCLDPIPKGKYKIAADLLACFGFDVSPHAVKMLVRSYARKQADEPTTA